MTNKRFIKIFFGVMIVLLLVPAGIVGLVDPFGYYHKPWFGLKNVNLNQPYQNPGYVKNYDYETALVGTSMTEGMRASEADKLFDTTTIKICQSGAHSMDIAQMLDLVCKAGKAKQVIVGLDANIFRKEYDTYRSEMPLYLYNDNPLDDVNYLFNKQVLFEEIPEMLQANKEGNLPEIDDYYIREASNYSKENALANYERGVLDEASISWDRAARNIENIVTVIENNPEITFYIYMPPYSMLFWDRYMCNGIVDNELAMQKQVVEAFLEYENVQLYYFMNDYSIITNLENYRDAGHYSPQVCSLILQEIHDGNYIITKDNYLSVFTEMENFVKNYDYESIFKDE